MSSTKKKRPEEHDIYARLSKAIDGSLEKVETQESDCRSEAKMRQLKVGTVHVDNNLSAWKQKRRRPGWDAMLERIRSGKIAGVIAYHDDRLMRHPRDLEDLLNASEECEDRYGFGVVLYLGGDVYDLRDDRVKGDLRQRTLYAWNEVANTSRRVRRKIEWNRKQGKINAVRGAFGYIDGTTQPDPEQAIIIRDIARMLLDDGMTWTQIANKLNSDDITTDSGRPWNRAHLRQMMSHSRHGGVAHWTDREGVKHSFAMPRPEGTPDDVQWPILDSVTFDRLQSFISGAKRGRARTTLTLLSGIAECAACGVKLVGANNTSAPMPDGSLRMTYRCPKDRGGCTMAVTAQYVDAVVRDFVLQWYEQRSPELEQAAHLYDDELETAKQHLAALEQNYASMYAKLSVKGLDEELIDSACAEVERAVIRQRELVSKLSTSEQVASRYAADALRVWDDPDTTVVQRRQMVAQAIRSLSIKRSSTKGSFGGKFNAERVVIEGR